MATVDERVTAVEDKMAGLREEMRSGFAQVDARLTRLEDRMERFEARVDGRFNHFDARLLALEQKMDRRFIWLVGMQFTTMLTVIGALAAAFLR